MLDENCPIEEVRTLFANDRFATEACGCRVLEASRGHAVCEFDIREGHLNAQGNVMGGAIFTLADFALAIACNIGEQPTVAVSNTIDYMNMAKGKKLRIVVKDTGCGIADIELARRPFYTSKPELERSGMGFAVMEAFMDSLEIESAPGEGTAVTMEKEIGGSRGD